MPTGKLRIKLIDLFINPATIRPGDEVKHRFLLQLYQPEKQGVNPAVTFAGDLKAGQWLPAIPDNVPDGYLVKGQAFDLADDEPLRIRLHYFHDVHRDWVRQLLGRLIELAAGTWLKTVKVIGVDLAQLISGSESLGLSKKTVSIKYGYQEVVIEPDCLGALGALPVVGVDLVAKVDVYRPSLPAPGSANTFHPVVSVKEGEVTASMHLQVSVH